MVYRLSYEQEKTVHQVEEWLVYSWEAILSARNPRGPEGCLDASASARRPAYHGRIVRLKGRLMGYALLLKGYGLADIHNSGS